MEFQPSSEIFSTAIKSFNKTLVSQLDEIFDENGIHDAEKKALLSEDILLAVGCLLDGVEDVNEEERIRLVVGARKARVNYYGKKSDCFHEGADAYVEDFYA